LDTAYLATSPGNLAQGPSKAKMTASRAELKGETLRSPGHDESWWKKTYAFNTNVIWEMEKKEWAKSADMDSLN